MSSLRRTTLRPDHHPDYLGKIYIEHLTHQQSTFNKLYCVQKHAKTIESLAVRAETHSVIPANPAVVLGLETPEASKS